MPNHHIVIVGGGAGGLELATRLGNRLGKKQRARITLIDAVLTHVWKPLLHEVAAGSMDSNANEVNFRAHAKQHGFEFQLGRMTGLDRTQREVVLSPILDAEGQEVVAERHIAYDTLVIAVGSTANDFGTPGAKEHALFLDNLSQARRFHKLLLNSFLRTEHSPKGTPRKLRIAIVGAGATGVELAAELRHASHELPFYGLHHVHPLDVELTVIEATDRILPALPERLSKAATQELTNLGVTVITSNAVASIDAQGLTLKNGDVLRADIKVWAAGIKAPDFLTTLSGLEVNRINQLMVTQALQTTEDENIFSFGDCAACPQPGQERPVPPRAQAAHQQAMTLASTLENRLQGKAPVNYVYHDRGSLISFSKYTAVGNLMGNLSGKSMMIEGKVARMFYISLYRMHQIALHGLFRTGLIWLSDRINKALHPRLKLH